MFKAILKAIMKKGNDCSTESGYVSGKTYAVPLEAWNKLVAEKFALTKQLEAAAEAFRKIEMATCDLGSFCNIDRFEISKINKLAQAGYRAAK